MIAEHDVVSHDGRSGSLTEWLSRFGVSWPGQRDPLWSRTRSNKLPGLHTSRALRRFLEVLRMVEHPVLLDVGPASGRSVSFLGHELSCKLVVADLYRALDDATRDGATGSRGGLIGRCLDQPESSIDGVLCWDLCDYLDLDEAETLASSVARMLRPGGAVLAMFSTITYEASESIRFAIDDPDHITYRPVPSALAQRQVWLSRDVVRMFRDLRVDETYLLAHGVREVLLRKPRGPR